MNRGNAHEICHTLYLYRLHSNLTRLFLMVGLWALFCLHHCHLEQHLPARYWDFFCLYFLHLSLIVVLFLYYPLKIKQNTKSLTFGIQKSQFTSKYLFYVSFLYHHLPLQHPEFSFEWWKIHLLGLPL